MSILAEFSSNFSQGSAKAMLTAIALRALPKIGALGVLSVDC
ncbi:MULTISPECIES: hypothetical protein [Nostoc]|nr:MULTISPECIES: hypothetical protein [Nostoc]